MNHLAHLFLAPDSELHRVGSLMGDFARGLDESRLPDATLQGLRHHRAVDAFTDQHPEVIASKSLFSSQRRRFAGVALDILYDHYLLRHWARFSDVDPHEFIPQVYEELRANRDLMPATMQSVTENIVRFDWFDSYRELSNIGFALDKVAGRIRFRNNFSGMIYEIREHDRELEARFLAFFPELQEFAKNVSV